MHLKTFLLHGYFFRSLVYFSSPLLILGHASSLGCFISIILKDREMPKKKKKGDFLCHSEQGMKAFENSYTEVFRKPAFFSFYLVVLLFFLRPHLMLRTLCGEATFKGFAIHSRSSLKWKRRQGTRQQLNPRYKTSEVVRSHSIHLVGGRWRAIPGIKSISQTWASPMELEVVAL